MKNNKILSFMLIITLIIQITLDKGYCTTNNDTNGTRPRSANSISGFNKEAASFSAKFFAKLADGVQNRSLITSPLAVLISAAPLALFSRGETYKEIRDVIGFKKKTIKKVFPKIINLLSKDQNSAVVDLAAITFVNKKNTLSHKFITTTKKVIGSRLRGLDFADQAAAADIINGWLANKTHHMIESLIKPEMLTSDAVTVLVNTLYFKSSWAECMLGRGLKADTFHSSKGPMTIKYMTDNGPYEYAENNDLDAQVLAKRFDNQKFAAIFILPNPQHCLQGLIKKLAERHVLSNLLKEKLPIAPVVTVQLPILNIKTNSDIRPILNEMGINQMYSGEAEFANILQKSPSDKTDASKEVRISKSVQGVKIMMDENGTQAAAAIIHTIPINKNTQVKVFKATHPYLFLIVREDLPLFIGCNYGE